MSAEEGVSTSTKRSLEDPNGESIEAPPKKKQRLSVSGNSNSNSNSNSNNVESKESEMMASVSDVRTLRGFDRPTHFEILASDCEKMIDFYTKVFQWKFSPMHASPTDKYWGIQTGPYSFGKDSSKALATYGIAGGLQQRKGDAPSGDAPNTFLVYIDVADIEDTIKLVIENGGKIIKQKTDIRGMGWVATTKDIEGGLIGLWQNAKSPHVKHGKKCEQMEGQQEGQTKSKE